MQNKLIKTLLLTLSSISLLYGEINSFNLAKTKEEQSEKLKKISKSAITNLSGQENMEVKVNNTVKGFDFLTLKDNLNFNQDKIDSLNKLLDGMKESCENLTPTVNDPSVPDKEEPEKKYNIIVCLLAAPTPTSGAQMYTFATHNYIDSVLNNPDLKNKTNNEKRYYFYEKFCPYKDGATGIGYDFSGRFADKNLQITGTAETRIDYTKEEISQVKNNCGYYCNYIQ